MKTVIISSLFVLLTSTMAHSGITKIKQTGWVGVWKDGNGGVMTIKERNGFLDITGKDKVSIYSCSCLVSNGTIAECYGNGTNHIKNTRFLYKSTLSKNNAGQLDETWKAMFKSGTLNGKARFKRNIQ